MDIKGADLLIKMVHSAVTWSVELNGVELNGVDIAAVECETALATHSTSLSYSQTVDVYLAV